MRSLRTEEQLARVSSVPSRTSRPNLKPLAIKCPICRELFSYRDYERNFRVCPACDYHFRLTANERINQMVDPGSFVEVDTVTPELFLCRGTSQKYMEQLLAEQRQTLMNKAVVTGYAAIANKLLAIAIMDSRFLGEGMDSVVGEKITCSIEIALERRIPLFISSSTGMSTQRGIASLMQIHKISIALSKLGEARLPYISLLTSPYRCEPVASFALLGDVMLAEPGDLLCLSQSYPVESSMKPPEGTADQLLQQGFLDAVVHRRDLRQVLIRLLRLYSGTAFPITSAP